MEGEEFPPDLRNVLDAAALRWVFVGGKGGVGKTTTSCSVACALARARASVLLVSTDPAHNLSDALGQKVYSKPCPVEGVANLSAMEIDPAESKSSGGYALESSKAWFQDLLSNLPGIDEAVGFSQIMSSVRELGFDVIVFDTAPTGHTLRLLGFPDLIEKGLEQLNSFQQSLGGILQMFNSLGSGPGLREDEVFDGITSMRAQVAEVKSILTDPEQCTFICVCIPEFLSLYETERLVQELTERNIDVRNIVVNQVLQEPENCCAQCEARRRVQGKYLEQIHDLYSEMFHVIEMPLQLEEVRGLDLLRRFSERLVAGK